MKTEFVSLSGLSQDYYATKPKMKTLVIDNVNDKPLSGMRWRKTGYKYMVRSDAGFLNTRVDHCDTLTESRKLASKLAKKCGWSEIFRWSENGVMIKPVFIASYDYEETTK